METIIENIEKVMTSFNEQKVSYIITINDLNEVRIAPRRNDNGEILPWGSII